jgi:Repeat of Unknown Function (DUF347)
MDDNTRDLVTKVPQVTLGFWIIKILATTLGETGGDAVTMSWLGETTGEATGSGYLIGTAIFGVIFVAAVLIQIRAKKFHPFVYWLTIVATTTVGTTLADYCTRSLGLGYTGVSIILLVLVIGSLLTWRWSTGSISVDTVRTAKAEIFYWVTIMFLADARDGAGRLGRGYKRDGLSRRGRNFRRLTFGDRSALLLHERLTRPSLLGSVHPDAAARSRRRRFSRQISRGGRTGVEPLHCIDRALYRDRRIDPGRSTKTRVKSALGRDAALRRPLGVSPCSDGAARRPYHYLKHQLHAGVSDQCPRFRRAQLVA